MSQVILRVRKRGEQTSTDYRLDAQYTLDEVKRDVDVALDRKEEFRFVPEGGGEPLVFDPKDVEVVSATLAGFVDRRKLK